MTNIPRWKRSPTRFCTRAGFSRQFRFAERRSSGCLLSRVIEIRSTKPSEAEPEADAAWNEQVTLEIAPHPELSDTQQKVIALDHGMLSGKAKIPVRMALLYYTLKRLGLETDPAARRLQDQQFVLLNGAELGTKTLAPTSVFRAEG